MANGKGKKIVSQSSRKGLKSLSVVRARAEKEYHSGIPRGGSKRKPVPAKNDMDKIPFRNSAIKKLKGKSVKK